MKKIFLILMLVTITLASQSQTKSFISTRVNYKMEPFEWTSWKFSNIRIDINPSIKRIEIFSNDYQIIKYSKLSKTATSKYNLYIGEGLDAESRLIGVTFQIFNDGTFYLIIEYKDFSYVYDIVEIDVN